MKEYTALIIDDEQPARSLIAAFLKKIAGIIVLGECENGFDGLKKIKELKPDIVFLDVQMPKLTGIELLEVLDEQPAIIFTTAYDQYALKAFELNAVDYLLKPFAEKRFVDAIHKAIERINNGKALDNPQKIVDSYDEQRQSLDRVVVKKGSQIVILALDNIHYLQAMDDFVSLHTNDGVFHKSRTMKYFEHQLPSNQFLRIHRSYIVNVNEISKLEAYDKDSYVAVLKTGDKLRVSRTGYKNIKERLSI